ncbi:MAG: uncharacterized protein QOC64_2925 [Solirubrobacteraceae bacterium]|nr:uncharacterized protein [Solirubrobacteraceae bacterium]
MAAKYDPGVRRGSGGGSGHRAASRPRFLWLLAGCTSVAVVAATPALARTAQGPPPAGHAPLQLTADSAEPGWVRMTVRGRPGTTVEVREQTERGSRVVVRMPLAGATSGRRRAAAWRCDRPVRRFTATAPGPGGALETASAEVTTPSCADRLRMSVVPARLRAGRAANVRITDPWNAGGLSATVCARPRGATGRCRAVRLRAGQTRITSKVRMSRRGAWTVELRTRFGQRLARTVQVQRGGRVRLLATGDSMIQIIDSLLAARLHDGEARVRSDAHISTGISKPAMFDWPAHARGSARTLHPDATIVFLGANDGFPMRAPSGRTAPCCDDAWIAEYARRARRMMRSYLRNGNGRVYWLLLPTPSRPAFARVFRAVNAGVRRAAAGFPDGVRLIDVGRVIAPGGRFRQRITYRDRSVSVRQGDGVHLSVAGAEIAASLIISALRRDGVLQ